MIITLNLSKITLSNIYFLDTKKNIIMDGNFSKLIFSNEWFVMNGIYILFPIEHIGSEIIMNKTQIRFNPFQQYNQIVINEFSKLEKNILEYYRQIRGCNCKIVPLLHKQMMIGFMKTNKEYKKQFSINENNRNIQYVLKISGIWETQEEIGLTYKLFEVNEL